MTEYEVKNAYFKWMRRLISEDENDTHKDLSYLKLLHKLHDTNFEYIMPMDENRATDGEDLRYRFANENSLDDREIATYLDNRPCSIFEMMVALAVRCEDHIMHDYEIGDRTGVWFWVMISSLDLNHMTDRYFDEEYVDYAIARFHNRDYKPNGDGGLFTVKTNNADMRNIEIWYQLHAYLNEIDE